MTSGSQFRPGPPPFIQAATDMIQARTHLTPGQDGADQSAN